MYRRPRSFNLAPHANARHGQSADPYRGVYVQRPVEICSKGCAPVMMPSLPISRGEAYQPSSSLGHDAPREMLTALHPATFTNPVAFPELLSALRR
jgi:hypothetical protein